MPYEFVTRQLHKNKGRYKSKLRKLSDVTQRVSEDLGRFGVYAIVAISMFISICVFGLSLDNHYRIFTDSFQTVLVNVSIRSAMLFSKTILFTVSMYMVSFAMNTLLRWVNTAKLHSY